MPHRLLHAKETEMEGPISALRFAAITQLRDRGCSCFNCTLVGVELDVRFIFGQVLNGRRLKFVS